MPKKTKNKARFPKSLVKRATKHVSYEEYRKVTEEFAKEVENTGYQVVASIPAVKKINGMEQPAGVTVAELLALAKMANVTGRALCIGASPNGQELVVVSVLKRPMVPRVIKPGAYWMLQETEKAVV